MACSNNNFGCTRGYYCEYADICPRLDEKLKQEFKEAKAIVVRLEGENYHFPIGLIGPMQRNGYELVSGSKMQDNEAEMFGVKQEEKVLLLHLEQNAIERQKFLSNYSVKNKCPFYKKNE